MKGVREVPLKDDMRMKVWRKGGKKAYEPGRPQKVEMPKTREDCCKESLLRKAGSWCGPGGARLSGPERGICHVLF